MNRRQSEGSQQATEGTPSTELCRNSETLVAELQQPCRTAVIVVLGTGLRCCELFALKWEDIHWDALTLYIRRAFVDGVIGAVALRSVI